MFVKKYQCKQKQMQQKQNGSHYYGDFAYNEKQKHKNN